MSDDAKSTDWIIRRFGRFRQVNIGSRPRDVSDYLRNNGPELRRQDARLSRQSRIGNRLRRLLRIRSPEDLERVRSAVGPGRKTAEEQETREYLIARLAEIEEREHGLIKALAQLLGISDKSASGLLRAAGLSNLPTSEVQRNEDGVSTPDEQE